jgi:anti-sigma factor RsiW
MPRLELIMTDNKKLTAEDARALFSEHIEGGLDDDARVQVDALLAADPVLAAEHQRLQKTMQLLKGLPQPDGPPDLVGKVRDRLAAERRAQAMAQAEPEMAVVPRRRFGGVEIMMGLAAAAGIAVFIGVVAIPEGSGPHGVKGAELIGEDAAVSTTLVAPGFPRALVMEQAVKAGMTEIEGDTYEGDRRAAARFMMALKVDAAKRGVEISGVLPDADRVRVLVKSTP